MNDLQFPDDPAIRRSKNHPVYLISLHNEHPVYSSTDSSLQNNCLFLKGSAHGV
jgi:hypothetical protein